MGRLMLHTSIDPSKVMTYAGLYEIGAREGLLKAIIPLSEKSMILIKRRFAIHTLELFYLELLNLFWGSVCR